jgi:hypothetical protein
MCQGGPSSIVDARGELASFLQNVPSFTAVPNLINFHGDK